MQERRKSVRRADDRTWRARLIELENELQARRKEDDGQEARSRRRRAIRHHCQAHLALRVSHVAGPEHDWNVDLFPLKGRILDVSHQGAQVFTKQPMDLHQEVSLMLDLPHATRIRTNCRVRWCKAIPEKGGYASGLSFESIAEKGRDLLARFLKEIDATAGL